MTTLQNKSLTLALIFLIGGCASSGSNSPPSSELLNPVSSQVAEFVSTVQYEIDITESIEINQYIGEATPQSIQFGKNYQELLYSFDAFVTYSVGVINLIEVKSNQTSIEQLIINMQSLEKNLADIDLTQQFYASNSSGVDSISDEMRAQKNLIDAYSTASPVIDNYAKIIRSAIDETHNSLDAAVEELWSAINQRHSSMLSFRANVIKRQDEAIEGLKLLDEAIYGDSTAWPKLLSNNWSIGEEFKKGTPFNRSNAKTAERILIARLETVQNIREQLKLPYKSYSNQLQELYKIENQTQAALQASYLLLEDWDSSQRLLAAGEPSALEKTTSLLWNIAYSKAID